MKQVIYNNAGAGSGKTYSLTHTLVNAIKAGKVKPEQVILTTFTTMAANEFKERAKALLYEEKCFDEAARLDHALIGTVHSVCQRMIGKYWFNLGLSPDMGVMAEEDAQYYMSSSLADLPTDDDLRFFHDYCRQFNVQYKYGSGSHGLNYNFWKDDLKRIVDLTTNYEITDYTESVNKSVDYIRKFVDPKAALTYSREDLLDIINEQIQTVRDNNRCKNKEDKIEALRQHGRLAASPTFNWYIELAKMISFTHNGPKATALKERVAEIWRSPQVFEYQERYITTLFRLAREWRDRFEQFKKEKNLLDFNDMEKYMRQLMEDKDICREISREYRWLFVDEFQDSSPIQVKIFDALSDLMEQSHWVGDYKQAIYRFRGSDTQLIKAVVDRISKRTNGCDILSLDTSYRSLPEIVDFTNAIFTKTFDGLLKPEHVQLKPKRESEEGVTPLQYFVTESPSPSYINKLIYDLVKNKGVQPKDIGLLARRHKELAEIAAGLHIVKIPCSVEETSELETRTAQLVDALLRIVSSERDTLSKANVAILTVPNFSARELIEQKLVHDDLNKTDAEFLSDVPLIKKLSANLKRYRKQSIASMVESIAVELDLFNEVIALDGQSTGTSALNAIIQTARAYEDHSIQLNLPSTIEGFLDYLSEVKPTAAADPEGVQLHTYHGAKGLQWKYVILTSLDNDVTDKKRAVAREFYGIHIEHTSEPSAENQYPDVYIRVTPWIFGMQKNAPDYFQCEIEQTPQFQTAFRESIEEANRLLYVGVTRAKDYLILHVKPKKPFEWFRGVGIDEAGETSMTSKWDIFGTGHLFHKYFIEEDPADKDSLIDTDCFEYRLNIPEQAATERSRRFLSPSKLEKTGEVSATFDFGKRIPLGAPVKDMATVGDCVHQIFAGIENGLDIRSTIEAHGLGHVLNNPEAIAEAWKNLTAKLTEHYGAPTKVFHERPFRHARDGQSVVGSIDLVWQTPAGDVLVDFKTNPQGASAVLDRQNPHFAGRYCGQLDAYTDALTAAGETVLARYIYYPVSSLLVEIK